MPRRCVTAVASGYAPAPRRGLATAQDERLLNEKRRHRDIPYDIRPRPSAQLSDLSRTYFEEEYLPGAFAPDILAANERSYEERLAACRMIHSVDDPVPTVLGLITLSRTPTRWAARRLCPVPPGAGHPAQRPHRGRSSAGRPPSPTRSGALMKS